MLDLVPTNIHERCPVGNTRFLPRERDSRVTAVPTYP